ncbi:MAG TPA: hypothetical protein VF587_18195 [Solirubrobacteraceae bacterium]
MSLRLRLLWLAALAAPAVLTLVLIAVYGENVPQWDEYTMVTLFAQHDQGTLDAGSFWHLHNEHRPVLPRLILFGLAFLTDWDLRVELYVDFAVAVATFALLVVALRRTLPRQWFVAASVVTAVLFFSPMQWENWLWGWQLTWFLSNLAAVGVLWALTVTVDRAPRAGLALAIACGLVASLSLGSGLLLWPIGLALLLLRGRPWRIWAVAGVATIAVYLIGYERPAHHPSTTEFVKRPIDFAEYVLVYLGRAFGFDTATGGLAGVALVAVFAVAAGLALRRRGDGALLDRAAIWLGLGVYCLGAALMTGLSRLGFGPVQAGASRYTTTALLFGIATVALVFVLVTQPRPAGRALTPLLRFRLSYLVAGPLLLLGLVNTVDGADRFARHGRNLDRAAACVRQATSPRDPCLRHPSSGYEPEQSRGIAYSRRVGWGGF